MIFYTKASVQASLVSGQKDILYFCLYVCGFMPKQRLSDQEKQFRPYIDKIQYYHLRIINATVFWGQMLLLL